MWRCRSRLPLVVDSGLLLSPASGRHCYLDLDNDRQSGIEISSCFHPELEFADEAELLRPVERKPDHEELEDFYNPRGRSS